MGRTSKSRGTEENGENQGGDIRPVFRMVAPSPYHEYASPLEAEGDALILPDVEAPFHDHLFINEVIEFAIRQGVSQCILAGDALHFDALSPFGKNWSRSGISDSRLEALEKSLEDMVGGNSELLRSILDAIESAGLQTGNDGLSLELKVSRSVMRSIGEAFGAVYYILGNHEGRLLRRIGTPLDPVELLYLLGLSEDPRWHIAPYYYMRLRTVNGDYLIEHPGSTGQNAAIKLADAHQCHVIMAHSHNLSLEWSTSGQYYAIQAGHCVDENMLPYAAQRHRAGRRHKSGAVIVYRGEPILLYRSAAGRLAGYMPLERS